MCRGVISVEKCCFKHQVVRWSWGRGGGASRELLCFVTNSEQFFVCAQPFYKVQLPRLGSDVGPCKKREKKELIV